LLLQNEKYAHKGLHYKGIFLKPGGLNELSPYPLTPTLSPEGRGERWGCFSPTRGED